MSRILHLDPLFWLTGLALGLCKNVHGSWATRRVVAGRALALARRGTTRARSAVAWVLQRSDEVALCDFNEVCLKRVGQFIIQHCIMNQYTLFFKIRISVKKEF